MYGAKQVYQTVESEKDSGYNSFGGESIFNNPNSEKSRTEYVQNLLTRLSGGKNWNDYNAADIFGSKVEPALFENAPYQPIDYGDVQGKTIDDNLRNLPAAGSLSDMINSLLRVDSESRLKEWGGSGFEIQKYLDTLSPERLAALKNKDPHEVGAFDWAKGASASAFADNIRTMTNSAKALVGGQLPYSDVLDIVSNRNELGNTIGTAGTFGMATLKDLGMSRLSAMQTGNEMMARIGNLMESIDPIGQRSRPQEWMLQPSQTVPLKQQDTQFGASYDQMERILAQQSEQNANVLNAAPDPAGRGLFGAEFALKTGTPMGGGGGGGGVDWGSMIGGLMSAYRGYQQGQQAQNPYAGGTGGGQRYNPDAMYGQGASSSGTTSPWDGYAASYM